MLYPPNTMLIVRPAADGAAEAAAHANGHDAASPDYQRRRDRQENNKALSTDTVPTTDGGKAWKLIRVRPCFV